VSGTDPSRQHAAVVKAILDRAFATGGEAYRVYLGEVIDPDDQLAYPYLIVWPVPARRGVTSLDGTGRQARTTLQITAVGQSPDEALAALDRVADALQGVTPTLPGRTAGQLRQPDDFAPPPVRQSDQMRTPSGRPPFIAVDQWELTSVPA
jgi:hypothetical protein